MGEAPIHRELIRYLVDVLKWLFRGQDCISMITHNRYSYTLTLNQQVNQLEWRSGLLRLPFNT